MNQLLTLAANAIQFIDSTGQLKHPLPASVNESLLLEFYRTMVLIRQFDKKAVALQRTGQLGTYPSCMGQEAFSTGIGFALKSDDVFVPYYRDQATKYLRGVKLHQILQLWGGDERGNLYEGAAIQDLPDCVPIATQITHAAGIATAMKIRGEHRAVVATCGEGATSRGDFYESINLAGVWHLPLVVVVNNNQWAISVPRRLQTGAETFADKATSAGIKGVQVDGNDVAAVYQATQHALNRARQGKGGTLIEAVTYRLGDHTTADDASRYRSAAELNQAWELEPIKRLQAYLHNNALWNPEKELALQAESKAAVEKAVDTYLGLAPQAPNEMFEYLFEELPYSMHSQKEQFIQKANSMGGQRHGH